MPKVTAFIPVYNRERYAASAVDSILAQTYGDFELLVVDDGSTDRSVEILQSYTDSRMRVVQNDGNRGIPYTRNRGLELARGEYLLILDSDDWSFPDRMAKQVAFLDAHPDYAEVGSWGRFVDSEGRPAPKPLKRQPTRPEDVRATLVFSCCLNNRSIMGRTELLREYGYRAEFPRCQDYDLHVRLAERHKLGNLPEVLVCGRLHEGRITRQTGDLGKAKKIEIAARQLEAAAVSFDERDLELHYALPRLAQVRKPLDEGFLDHTERWLCNILESNDRSRYFSGVSLRGAVGTLWVRACRRASSEIGARAWRRFAGSRLCSAAFAGAMQTFPWFPRSGLRTRPQGRKVHRHLPWILVNRALGLGKRRSVTACYPEPPFQDLIGVNRSSHLWVLSGLPAALEYSGGT